MFRAAIAAQTELGRRVEPILDARRPRPRRADDRADPRAARRRRRAPRLRPRRLPAQRSPRRRRSTRCSTSSGASSTSSSTSRSRTSVARERMLAARAARRAAPTTRPRRSRSGSTSTTSETAPLVEHYRAQGKLVGIHGDAHAERGLRARSSRRSTQLEARADVIIRKSAARDRADGRRRRGRRAHARADARAAPARRDDGRARPASPRSTSARTAASRRSRATRAIPAAICISPNEHDRPRDPRPRTGRRGRHRLVRRRRDARRPDRRLRRDVRRRRDLGRGAAAARRLPGRARRPGSSRRASATASATSRHAVQQVDEEAGFSVVRSLVGHGVGRVDHEEPQVPNFGEPGRGPLLAEGMTLAIEPMITAGGSGRLRARRRLVDLDRRRLALGPFRAHRRGHRRRPADPHEASARFATMTAARGLCACAFFVLPSTVEGGMMAVKEEKIEVEGEVIEALPSTMFRVQLDGGHTTCSRRSPGRCASTTSASFPATRSRWSCRRTT